MANWQGMQLTKQGRALMAKLMAHANGNLPTVLTRIALGGGVLPTGQNLENMTGLLNEHTSLPVSGYSIIGNEVVRVETSFKSGDFPQAVKLHEIGVFATTPTMARYCTLTTTPPRATPYRPMAVARKLFAPFVFYCRWPMPQMSALQLLTAAARRYGKP